MAQNYDHRGIPQGAQAGRANQGAQPGGPPPAGHQPWELSFPLPTSTSGLLRAAPQKPRPDIHPGLLIGKLAPWYFVGRGRHQRTAQPGQSDFNRASLFDAVCASLDERSRLDLARAWAARAEESRSAMRGCDRRVYVTASETILWLASPTPAELGFCLHFVYGLPYLPSTALKGVARAWCAYKAATQPDANGAAAIRQRVDRVFGPELANGENDARAGSVVVLDGVPLVGNEPRWRPLELDVMTPHHSRYYANQREQDAWPHDCESPTPLPFLCIRAGVRFALAIAPRRAEADGAQDDVKWAWEMLEQGLENLGIGAKTTSGYGLMRPEGARNAGTPNGPRAAGPDRRAVPAREPEQAAAVPASRTHGRVIEVKRNQGVFIVEAQGGARVKIPIPDVVRANATTNVNDILAWAKRRARVSFVTQDGQTGRDCKLEER